MNGFCNYAACNFDVPCLFSGANRYDSQPLWNYNEQPTNLRSIDAFLPLHDQINPKLIHMFPSQVNHKIIGVNTSEKQHVRNENAIN